MAAKSGIAAQLGFAEETTPGTRVAPTLFLPILSEKLADTQDPVESGGIIAGMLTLGTDQRNGGLHKVGGDVQMELYDHGWGLLLKHMFGTLTTTGSGSPYTHTATPGSIDGKALTVQVGRPDVGGTVRPFDYLGMKISEWEIAGKIGEICTLGLTFTGMSSEVSDTLATASYPSTLLPLKFAHGSFTLASSAVKISDFSIKATRNLADSRYVIGTNNADEALQEGLQVYSGTATVEFSDMTQYNAYTAHTDLALELAFTLGSNSFTITGNVRLDDNTPQVGGRSILTQSLPMTFLRTSGGEDSTAIQAVLIDGTATP